MTFWLGETEFDSDPNWLSKRTHTTEHRYILSQLSLENWYLRPTNKSFLQNICFWFETDLKIFELSHTITLMWLVDFPIFEQNLATICKWAKTKDLSRNMMPWERGFMSTVLRLGCRNFGTKCRKGTVAKVLSRAKKSCRNFPEILIWSTLVGEPRSQDSLDFNL